MSATMTPARARRIGEVARELGTTTRTIRYYEEIGLLPAPEEQRPSGHHRLYDDADVERLREIIRLKDLLGVSLDELRTLLEAQDARAELRAEYQRSDDPERRRGILVEGIGHLDRQLELVRRRQRELTGLERELTARRRRLRRRLTEAPQ